MSDVRRIDRYTIEVDGKRVRATEQQEQMIRNMTPEQVENFLRIMGQ